MINKNVVRDKNNEIQIYYLPTSLVNRDKFVALNKELYMSGSGSKSTWITSVGWDLDAYLSLMDMEKSEKWDDKYTPHPTSYNSSGDDNLSEEDKGGRPSVENATNDSTLATQGNNTNKSIFYFFNILIYPSNTIVVVFCACFINNTRFVINLSKNKFKSFISCFFILLIINFK